MDSASDLAAGSRDHGGDDGREPALHALIWGVRFWFASIKVAAILAFIALAASYVFGWSDGAAPGFSGLTEYGGFAPFGWAAVLAGAVTVLFSLTGAEIVTVAAAESQVGARVLARLTTSVILRILLFYAGSVFCILLVLPWNRVVASQSPFVQALAVMDVPWAHFLVSAVILTAVLSCLNSAFYVCSRVLFGLAQHRDAPAWLVQVNERRVPARSVWISAAAGVLGVLVAIASPDRVFSFLVNASGALMIVVYALVALAQVKLRHRREAAGRAREALAVWLFPWASWTTVLSLAAVGIAMMFSPTHSAAFRASFVAIAVAVIGYRVLRSRRGR